MAKGEKELRCLNKVKTFISQEDDGLINNSFGLLENERKEIIEIINEAKPNPSSSEFPDYIFNDGFIEHFRVTSSKETKKGSTHTRQESEFNRKIENETLELMEEWDKNPSYDKVRSKTWELKNTQHSHEYLVKSFKNNWESHINSLQKYINKNKKNVSIGIFMIEYPEFALSMYEDIYKDWIDGMSFGDMRSPEKFKEYRLSRDKQLLEYIFEFKNLIKYVIFVNINRCEIFKTDKIPYIINLIPWDYRIDKIIACNVYTLSNISIPYTNTGGSGE